MRTWFFHRQLLFHWDFYEFVEYFYEFVEYFYEFVELFCNIGIQVSLGSLGLFIGIKFHWDERDDEKSFKAKVRTFTLIKFLSLSFLWDIIPLGLSSYWDFWDYWD